MENERRTREARLSYRRKLDRADHHLQDLQETVDRWLAGVHLEVIPYGTDQEALTIRQELDLSADVSAILGDVVQCQRQSLDHITFALASKSGMLTPEEEEAVMFPARGKSQLPPDGGRALKSLDSADLEAIRVHVPPPDSTEQYHRDLVLLNDLARIDRHRSLFVAAAGAIPVEWSINSAGSFHLIGPQTAPPNGSRATLATWAPVRGEQMQMRANVHKGVEFVDGPAAEADVLKTLQRTMSACRTVCEDLERRLG